MREQIGKDDSNSPPHRRKARSDLVHLRSLLSVLPATATGQVTSAWGEIEAALARRMKLREVWEAAKLDGPRDSVPTISRIRLAAAAATPFIYNATTARTNKRRTEPAESAARSIS